MFVCGPPFCVTLSRNICFITVQCGPHRTASKLANGIKYFMKFYDHAGFILKTALMDKEFEKVKKKLKALPLTTVLKMRLNWKLNKKSATSRSVVVVVPNLLSMYQSCHTS